VYLLPALVLIGALAVYPLFYAIVTSFQSNSVDVAGHRFIGLANYIAVFNDSVFRQASLNTLLYFAFVTFGSLAGGVLVGFWLHGLRRMRGPLLAMVVLPWAVPGTVSAILWSFIFSPQGGLVNSFLQAVGLISKPIVWFNSPLAGMAIISLTLVWETLPIVAIIILAGLESIPRELYEQAAVDGASGLQNLLHISLPLLRPALAIALVDVAALGIAIFDEVYVLGGSSVGTVSVVMRVYMYAFTNINFGQAMAASLLVAVVTVVITIVYMRLVYREVSYAAADKG
jgi:ABC-type sugar transport system permease subunit